MPTYFHKKEEEEPVAEETKDTKEKKSGKGKPRIHALDEWRGFAIFCMIFYHAFYSMGMIFNFQLGLDLLQFFSPLEPLFAGLFILISGICSNLSHSNIERGAKLFLIAYLVTVISYFAAGEAQIIRFGILHMLSIAMIFYGIAEKVLKKIPLWLGFALSIIFFVFSIEVTKGFIGIPQLYRIPLPVELYQTDFLYPLGFIQKNFTSSDYFPLMPWLFLFIAGGFLGRLIPKKKFPKFMFKKRIGFFGWMGKHSLLIYLAHQPVIFGICYLVNIIIGK